MTGLEPPVDWTAVDRRGRRQDAVAVVCLTAFFASLVALTGGLGFVEGTAAWWALAGYLGFFAVLLVLQRTVPRMRRNAVRGHRFMHALREHIDPGPELRDMADVYARRQARLRGVVWLFPLPVVGMLLGGRWDRPFLAVPAAVLLALLAAAGAGLVHRQVRAARRWVADPPGPIRDVAPPNGLERWTGGRRLVGLVVVCMLVAFAAGLLAAVLD
ncbi:hypothetical protein [uncultured Modestobacter sp.]|uniref:hypothetical protein n=1 Tax=uncultured Modestobacter sp. TaxID=380048 RepID=UPI00261A17AD|nr:hypothetical protein [uncultured Modestobacter sp.]